MNKEIKKTAGQKIWEHVNKMIPDEDHVREYSREQAKEIIKNVALTCKEAAAFPIYQNKDFYVVCMQMEERMLMKKPKFMFFARHSCPTPIFQQSVWKYHHLSKDLEYLWTICDKLTFNAMLQNPQKYINNAEYGNQCKFVHLMANGELESWVKKENSEDKLKSGILTILNKDQTKTLDMPYHNKLVS